jgi:hypothetical protein
VQGEDVLIPFDRSSLFLEISISIVMSLDALQLLIISVEGLGDEDRDEES